MAVRKGRGAGSRHTNPDAAAREAGEPRGKRYDVRDWYWAVAGDEGFVWSSARAVRVPVGDAVYRRHLSEGGRTTAIDSVESMRWVWAQAGIVQDPSAQYRMVRAQRFEADLPIGDQLDAIIGQVRALADFVDALQAHVSGPRGEVLQPAFRSLIDRIDAIKREVPKP